MSSGCDGFLLGMMKRSCKLNYRWSQLYFNLFLSTVTMHGKGSKYAYTVRQLNSSIN